MAAIIIINLFNFAFMMKSIKEDMYTISNYYYNYFNHDFVYNFVNSIISVFPIEINF